ncbi:succinate-semialdehyde dehydrogenase / glutarate-semialdehyde dehydrogenase [Sporobacter termitidis DSM 10068]|uniref:Succinate-semialdehyde dehydrogenase / glutarate-semialdehyde dehydrogenase n=1 Tax=Sporobacter termitidis DSM 10068 TaxID=1123282 RepID=A0A1M5ZCY1_9FIRM|nr:aldehyde dehydrogenase family protein [Sporobacter termitidis]SHI22097.1 succinate-semialdehyde dehydrogenase / glutarate-semialdehyde dehydrogenase [Sporobacter termitidis DSM 10068]
MYKQYIGGKLAEGRGAKIDVTNPANDALIASYSGADAAQAQEALQAAAEAFKTFRGLPLPVRLGYLAKLREAMLENMDHIVELDSLESGKPHQEAVLDFWMGVGCIEYYSEEVKRIQGQSLQDLYGPRGAGYNIVERRPVGVVVAHLAWNFPLLNIMCKLPPAVASGCACIIKPSVNTPLASLFIGELCEKIGFPAGAVNIISGPSSVLGKELNSSTIPRLLTCIGSAETGKQIMQQGSTSVKSYSLELGGNAPCIVMPDADLEAAVDAIVSQKYANAGQVCVNYNRVFVHKDVYDRFLQLTADAVKKVKVGAMNEYPGENVMGPIITREARDKALAMIDDAVKKGARLLAGGTVPEGREKGNWLTPTLLADCADSMRVFQEEQFAPILAVTSFTDLDDTLRRAVDTEYGLRSYLYTHDARVIGKCFERFESGVIVVNNASGGPNVPHVGIKGSGVLCGTSSYGLNNYYDLRVLCLKP